jgi:hypothetical protein
LRCRPPTSDPAGAGALICVTSDRHAKTVVAATRQRRPKISP